MLDATELDRLIPAVPEDPDALETIYRGARRELFVFAYGMLRQREAAEDAVSETMVRLYRCADRYRPSGNGRAYLYRICRNAALEQLRRQRTEPESAACVVSDPSGEDRLYLEQLLGTLSVPQRQVMILHYFADLTFKEIAAVLGVPEGTVKWRHSQALKRCRTAAEQEESYA